MRLRKSQILLMITTFVVVISVVILNLCTSDNRSSATNELKDFTSEKTDKQLVFDRKNRPLSSEDTTLET